MGAGHRTHTHTHTNIYISLSRLVCGMCDHFNRTFHIPAAKEICQLQTIDATNEYIHTYIQVYLCLAAAAADCCSSSSCSSSTTSSVNLSCYCCTPNSNLLQQNTFHKCALPCLHLTLPFKSVHFLHVYTLLMQCCCCCILYLAM